MISSEGKYNKIVKETGDRNSYYTYFNCNDDIIYRKDETGTLTCMYDKHGYLTFKHEIRNDGNDVAEIFDSNGNIVSRRVNGKEEIH